MLRFDSTRATNKVRGFKNVEEITKRNQNNLDKVVFEHVKLGFEEFGQNQSPDSFRGDLEITKGMQKLLESLAKIDLQDRANTQKFLQTKGLYLFETLHDKLNGINRNHENRM